MQGRGAMAAEEEEKEEREKESQYRAERREGVDLLLASLTGVSS